MSSIDDIQRQWDKDLATRQAALAELQAQRQPLQDAMAAFEATRKGGAWNQIGHSFRAATTMRDTRQALEKLDRLEEGMDYAFAVIVENAAAQLKAAALQSMRDGLQLRREYAAISQALGLLPETMESLTSAIRTCNFARWEENGFSMPLRGASDSWTEVAVAAIDAAKSNLRQLRQIVPETPRLPPDIVAGLQPGETQKNKDILKAAGERLSEVQQGLGAFAPPLKARQEEILDIALAAGRDADPAIGRLAAALRPYLPQAGAQPKPGSRAAGP